MTTIARSTKKATKKSTRTPAAAEAPSVLRLLAPAIDYEAKLATALDRIELALLKVRVPIERLRFLVEEVYETGGDPCEMPEWLHTDAAKLVRAVEDEIAFIRADRRVATSPEVTS